MAVFSSAIWALAMQTGTALPPLPPQPLPPDKVLCILAIAAVGEPADAPFASINYYESGSLRIERELPEGAEKRDTEDVLVQLDNVWYAQGRAYIVGVSGANPSSTGALVPHIQMLMTSSFAKALTKGRQLAIWDKEGRQEQFDLANLDSETAATWNACIKTFPPPMISSTTAYKPQGRSQILTPLNKPDWITAYDYPTRMMREEMTGMVSYRLDVGVNGRVKNCVTDPNEIDPTGAVVNNVPELNSTTCSLIRRRARFLPATDASGRPIMSPYSGRVRWMLPD